MKSKFERGLTKSMISTRVDFVNRANRCIETRQRAIKRAFDSNLGAVRNRYFIKTRHFFDRLSNSSGPARRSERLSFRNLTDLVDPQFS